MNAKNEIVFRDFIKNFILDNVVYDLNGSIAMTATTGYFTADRVDEINPMAADKKISKMSLYSLLLP